MTLAYYDSAKNIEDMGATVNHVLIEEGFFGATLEESGCSPEFPIAFKITVTIEKVGEWNPSGQTNDKE